MESSLLADLARHLDGGSGVTGTKRSLHLHLKKTEVLGDPPYTTPLESSSQRKKQRWRERGRFVLPLRGTAQDTWLARSLSTLCIIFFPRMCGTALRTPTAVPQALPRALPQPRQLLNTR